MKRRVYLFCAAALCVLVMTGSARAAGLTEFQESGSYSVDTFRDVPRGAWYVAGVRASYLKGIMQGAGEGTFLPQSTVTRAEAVTIAARVHATYTGQTIPDAAGEWYAKYYLYAKQNQLLPASVVAPGDLTGTANRGFIAYVFSKVVDESDLPAVNLAASIPDLYEVPAEYRDAAARLYRAGVLTGREGGKFDAMGLATRAEIATIAMRLIEPGERVSGDPKLDDAYVQQQINMRNSAPILNVRGGVACRMTNYDGVHVISYRDGAGVEKAFTADNARYLHMYTTGGKLYGFSNEVVTAHSYGLLSDRVRLVELDMDTGAQRELWLLPELEGNKSNYASTKEEITPGGLVEYDGNLYFTSNYVNSKWSVCTLWCLGAQGEAEALLKRPGVMLGMTVFDGRVLFLDGGALYGYSLAQGTLETVAEGLGDICVLRGATMTYLRDGAIWRASIALPEVEKKLCDADPADHGEIYALNYHGDNLCFTDEKGWLNEVAPDGTMTRGYMNYRLLTLHVFGDELSFVGAQYNLNNVMRVSNFSSLGTSSGVYNWFYTQKDRLPSWGTTITPGEVKVEQNKRVQLKIANKTIGSRSTWENSDPTIATLDPVTMLVSAHSPGVTTLTYINGYSTQKVTCTVTVVAPGTLANPHTPDFTETGTKLTAQEIFAKCSPAVFAVEALDSEGDVWDFASGFFIDEKGTAVTSVYAILGAESIRVRLADGTTASATVIATDEDRDLAILKVAVTSSPYLELGDSSKVLGGAVVYAISSPLGLDNTMANGLISNAARDLGDGIVLFQISVPISWGSNGGALINEYGQVIGVAVPGYLFIQNLNFAVPIQDVLDLMK